MERAPTYATECQEIIATKSLRTNVCLKGLGSPSKVLEEAVSIAMYSHNFDFKLTFTYSGFS
jgi:hypothetical protein